MKWNFAAVRGGSWQQTDSRNLKHYIDTTMFVDGLKFGVDSRQTFDLTTAKVRELTGQRKKNLAKDCPARIRILSIHTNQIKSNQKITAGRQFDEIFLS